MSTDEGKGIELLESIHPVSRETIDDLRLHVELLRKWQKSQNLVAPKTLDEVWVRHVVDSAQCVALRPDLRRWVDLGSGAGFPGMVTAILSKGHPGAVVHLVESNYGKAAFLRAVARATGAPAIVHAERIDAFTRAFTGPVDAVSARALAPLVDLLGFAAPFCARGAVALFHKGRDFAAEQREASRSWTLDLVEHESKTEVGSRLIEIRRMTPKTA